jgi:hypothetical protein
MVAKDFILGAVAEMVGMEARGFILGAVVVGWMAQGKYWG